MLEDAMPGESLLSNGVSAEHHLKQQQAAARNGPNNKALQEMADKLEKSEAGRKKLRQAISMLKEKVEANEKVLQVNEILRQECEKERLRAEAERNKAEEEKRLREQVEEEGHSTKEQLVRVLQRLDAVERNCKADHNEIERMRKEMKQAIVGLGGTVKAIEAAHSTFESLEKDLLGKVSDAVCASKKSASVAETAISDAKGAQATASAAEKLSESLVARVAVLQEQGLSLDQRVTLLQQEILKRQLEPPDNEPKSNGKPASNVICLAADKPSRGMVLSKNQQQACTRLTSPTNANKDCLPEGPAFSPKRAEVRSSVVNGAKPADRNSFGTCGSLSPKLRNGAKGAGINGRGSLADGPANNKASRDTSSPRVGANSVQDKSKPVLSKENIVREALDAAKEKRKLQRTFSSNKVVLQAGKSSSCLTSSLTSNGTHAVKEHPVSGEEFRGRLLVDSSSGSVLALLENEKSNYVNHRTENTRGTNVEDNAERRPCIKNKLRRAPDDSGVETKLDIGNPLLLEKEKIFESPNSGTKTNRNRDKREKLPVALLKDITKLFLKEKKSHEKVERKLAALQKVLQNSEDDESAKQELTAATLGNRRKRKRRESLKEHSNVRACVRGVEQTPQVKSNGDNSFSSQGPWVGGVVARGACEVGAGNRKSNNIATEDDRTGPLQPPANNSDPIGWGNDVFAAGWKCQEIFKDSDIPQLPDVGPASLVLDSLAAAPNVIDPSQEMDIDIENVGGDDLSGGWDSDSEDEMGEDWWTQERILLSPSLPKVLPPSLPLEKLDSNAALPWNAASDMNLEDFSLFLDVLPPIDQEVCNEERAVASLPDVASSISETEELHIDSRGTAVDGQRSKELQRGLATEQPSSNLHKCRERSPSNNLVQCLESGSKLSANPGGCLEDEGKEIVITGSSFCDNSISSSPRPEPSFCPQDISVLAVGKSEGAHDRLTVDSGVIGDDVLQDSKGVVKEEKVDAAQCAAREHVANLFPYTVELVVEDLAQETGVNSTRSCMAHGSLGSTTDISNKIMEAFGRTREVLERALNHSNDDAFGSSLAVAPEIASFFVSSTLSKSDLMCIFIASLVDSHALWDNKNTSSCLGSDCKSLELLADIVKQVLAAEVFQNILSPDQAFLLFAVQLQKFLIQGSIQAVCQRSPGEAFNEGCAMEQCFHFATPSSKLKKLKALISGGKLLAVLCKTIGKLDFLRSSIYRVLRFCDMDNECLLTIISSVACVDYVSLFSVDKDDVVGQAVRVVISELLHDSEVGRPAETSSAKKEEIECQLEMQQGSFTEAERSADCTLLLQSLRALREIIGEEEGLSFERFVPRLVELFHGVITITPGSQLIGNRHLFQRSLLMITCDKMEPKSTIDANGLVKNDQTFKTFEATDETCTGIGRPADQIGQKDDDRSPVEDSCWRDVTVKRSIQPTSQSESDANLIEEWEQKFYDITNALELVASHLGWEWTYNDFIVEHLWKLVSPGAPSMTVACVAHMFGLLGRLGREVDSTELPGVDELRKSLLVVLCLDQSSPSLTEGPMHNFSFRAQVAAAQALLVLSSSNRKDEVIPRKDPERIFSKSSELHAKSVKSLWNWVQASKPEIQEILPSSLRCALLSIDKNNFVPIF